MPSANDARRRASFADLRSSSLRPVIVAVAAASLFWPSALSTSTLVEAKTPGKTYCFYRVCHRVMTLEETRRAVGKRMIVHASHYDDPRRDRFNPSNLTSSGEWFRAGVPDNAASPKLPNGTVILAWNPATRQSAVLRINNAGPYWKNRTLDVSRAAADRLGFGRQGVAQLHIQVLRAATSDDVIWRKGRRYAAVPGPIGTFSSFELAVAEASRRMGAPVAPPVSSTAVAALNARPSPLAPFAVTGPIESTDAVDAATAIAHLPGDLPAMEPAGEPIAIAEAMIPPPPQFTADLAPLMTLVSAPAQAAAAAAPPTAVASAEAPAPARLARTSTPARRTTEAKAAVPRTASMTRLPQLASLNAAPQPAATPPRRRPAVAASQRKPAAVADLRRNRLEPARTAARKPKPAQQQRLADLDDFFEEDDDTRPTRTQRRPGARTSSSDSYTSDVCRSGSLSSCELPVTRVVSTRGARASSNR